MDSSNKSQSSTDPALLTFETFDILPGRSGFHASGIRCRQNPFYRLFVQFWRYNVSTTERTSGKVKRLKRQSLMIGLIPITSDLKTSFPLRSAKLDEAMNGISEIAGAKKLEQLPVTTSMFDD